MFETAGNSISKVKGMGNAQRAVGGALFKAAVIIVICYAAETGIMHLLARFNLENSAIAPVLDSLALILIMTPLVYLLFVRPMKGEMEEKKALSASLEKLHRTLLTVSNRNQALVRATDEQQFMDDVCRVLTETGGYRMAWIGIAGHDAEKTVRPAAYSGHNEGYVETLNITWADAERGQSPTGSAIRKGKPVVVRKIASDAHFPSGGGGGVMETLKRGYASMAALPLTDGETVIGSLNIYSEKADAFDAGEVRLLTEFADDLSFGMHHQRIKTELEASEKKFKGLADNAFVGIMQSTLDGRILYANNALLEMFEFDSLEEFISAGALQRWKNPEDRKEMVEKLKSSGHASFDAEMLTKTGKTITALYSAVVTDDTLSATVMDVTERKKAEELLRTYYIELEMQNEELRHTREELEVARAKYFDFYNLAPVGYFTIRGQGFIVEANLTAANLLGMERDRFAGEKFTRFIAAQDQDVYYLFHKKLFETGTPQTCEVRITRSDGGLFWAHLEAAVAGDAESGAPVCHAVMIDITERKKAEEALRSANEDLKTALENIDNTYALMLRQEKLASIGTLSAGVAHEILNPLNIIGTIAQVLLMDEWPEKTKENLNEIMAQIRRATKITNNLRMFAHVHKREITAVDVHVLFDKTAALIEYDLNLDNITVDRDYDQNLPLVFVDQDLLAQVLLNLLNNARHALQEVKNGGKKSISIKTGAFAGAVEIRLSNNGPRIPEEIIGKIFDPFFTTKDPNKGTGLGLSMAYTFIRDFGGSITVQNEAPEGVTFIITLPTKGKENENTGR